MFRDTLLTGPETHVLRRILVEFLGNPNDETRFPAEISQNSHVRCPVFQGKWVLGGFRWRNVSLRFNESNVSWEFLLQETTALRNNVSFQGILRLKGKTYIYAEEIQLLYKHIVLSQIKGMLHTFGTLQENSSNSTCFLVAIISSMDPIPVFWLSMAIPMIDASWAKKNDWQFTTQGMK